MKPSEVAQAACDKLSFTDSATISLANKFCIRRYSMIWDSCLWNDTLGVISTSVTNGTELVTLDQTVTATYASGSGYNMFLDFPVAARFTVTGETDGIEIPAAEWVSFFQLDPNTWNNVDSRKSTPNNFVNLSRLMTDGATTSSKTSSPRLERRTAAPLFQFDGRSRRDRCSISGKDFDDHFQVGRIAHFDQRRAGGHHAAVFFEHAQDPAGRR